MALERVLLASPIATAGGRVIVTPFQFVTSGEDNLRLVAFNSLAYVTLTVQGRRLDDKGQIQVFAYNHVPQSDRSVSAEDFPLGAGALLNLTVVASSGAPIVGQTFALVQIIRGFTGATIVLGTLLQGYVTVRQGLGWPGSPIESSIAGGGYHRIVVGSAPAAGADWVETVPPGARWQLLAVQASLTASAVVATRWPSLFFDDGATLHTFSDQGLPTTASDVQSYCWFISSPQTSNAPFHHSQAPLPNDAFLLAGDRFRVGTLALDVADQWTAPRYLVREWLEAA